MAEDRFSHQQGLITKAEVRAVVLSKLRLDAPDLCLWDLGAGSGSVAVEAACFLRRGRIIAVERSPERIADIRANKRRFGLLNLEIVQAELPGGMEALPRPDRVFIGGGGRALPAILKRAADSLRPGGVLAVNTVVLESLQAARAGMNECGLAPETVQVQISRARDMPHGQRLQAENPVWILWGRKPAG
jgi:precorrin-6Y C5,15-methyltransferase (decarboxylating)